MRKKKIKRHEKEKIQNTSRKLIQIITDFRWWFILVDLYIFECKSLNSFLKSRIIINIYFINFRSEILSIKIASSVTSLKI